MKVGILTFPNSTSYGAVLQMYALYHTVQQMGHDAEVINYQSAFMKAKKHVKKSESDSSFPKTAKQLVQSLLHCRLRGGFRQFEKRMMKRYPSKSFAETAKLVEYGKRYDAVICGSDQVWNPDITGTDLSYFLGFCGKDTKRISYAPSFGIETFSDAFSEAIRPELEQFSAVSVREAPGQALVQRLLGREVPVVVDPTLLMTRDEWTLHERAHPAAKGDYILYYTIRSSTKLFRRCMELSAKTGMKVVVVGGNLIKKLRNRDPQIEYAVDISPDEWLYLMHHARYVVTNSFHGTAFSINYRKEFYVEFSSLTNSRLAQIIGMLGLEARVVRDDVELCSAPVDYTVTEAQLPEMREASAQFLRDALH